jgi:hypothetical protein
MGKGMGLRLAICEHDPKNREGHPSALLKALLADKQLDSWRIGEAWKRG